MPPPLVAFCITCKNRVQHLRQTLPQNLADNADYPNARFILLDYASPDDLLEYLKANFRQAIEAGRLIVYSLRDSGPFRMAHAKNMAHRLGMREQGRILVNLDADNFTGPGFASYLAQQFEAEGSGIFLWAKMVRGEMARGISGRIAVTAEAFTKSGGYDEQFHTWSPDDKDFNLRLQRLGYRSVEIQPQFLNAVLHNDKMRFKDYPHIRQVAHLAGEDSFEAVECSEVTIANSGQIGLGTVYRNFDFGWPVEVKPIPTRIFGIGMHKTATTSLHHAFEILGFNSAHWMSAHWAKAIWEQMQSTGHSTTLEQHYALCDLPITLLYKELDKGYPGSKFILTVRDEDLWLKSVEDHWNPERNKFRAGWSTDPFTHRVHKLLYGTKGFDGPLFLARYRRHNAEVLEYFKGRPKDLLVMEMDQSAGWNQLCPFLDVPVPEQYYPRKFQTERSVE